MSYGRLAYYDGTIIMKNQSGRIVRAAPDNFSCVMKRHEKIFKFEKKGGVRALP